METEEWYDFDFKAGRDGLEILTNQRWGDPGTWYLYFDIGMSQTKKTSILIDFTTKKVMIGGCSRNSALGWKDLPGKDQITSTEKYMVWRIAMEWLNANDAVHLNFWVDDVFIGTIDPATFCDLDSSATLGIATDHFKQIAIKGVGNQAIIGYRAYSTKGD